MQAEFQDSQVGSLRELPNVGSALENPYVYDASARELKAMAEHELLKVTRETLESEGRTALIRHLEFRRRR